MPSGRSTECPKTVVVLGAAYGGSHAAQVLAAGIPEDWRVILIDRNSHANHVYILPRLAVLPGHEHKAFIPYNNVFLLKNTRHLSLRAHITSFHSHHITLSQAFPEHGIDTTLHFDYAIYALGSHLPEPLNLWGSSKNNQPTLYRGLKSEGIAWLKQKQQLIEQASSVLVVGGGALGIQFATDIASVHPGKQVTLLHSRHRLLPRFDEAMHSEILQTLESMNVDVILGERMDLASVEERPGKRNALGQRVARTLKGREIAADLLLLCTGQTPNTHLLTDMDPTTVDSSTSMAHVLRTMQLGVLSPTPTIPSGASSPASSDSGSTNDLEAALKQLALADEAAADIDPLGDEVFELEDDDESEPEELEDTPYPHIFAVGDAADAFGAIPAGHNAYFQGEVAARNVLRLIRNEGQVEQEPLELYKPGPPAIKVSLGLTKSAYQINGIVGTNNDNPEDLQAAAVWSYFGAKVEDEAQMFA